MPFFVHEGKRLLTINIFCNKFNSEAIPAKPLGCAALAAVCALSTIYVTSYKAFAATGAYEGHSYELDSSSRQDSLNKANKFNETIAEEGFVLLQNKNNALPISTSESSKKKVNLFFIVFTAKS